eukprot:SM000258S09103  [mRNA]  locus=s258:136780:138517:+ [translate_table: standard]
MRGAAEARTWKAAAAVLLLACALLATERAARCSLWQPHDQIAVANSQPAGDAAESIRGACAGPPGRAAEASPARWLVIPPTYDTHGGHGSARAVDVLPDYQQKGVQQLLHFLGAHVPEPQLQRLSVIENGCDIIGRVGKLISASVRSYVGMNCPFEHHGLEHFVEPNAPNALYISTDCSYLPFRDASFDVAFSDNVLEHANPVESFIEETFRVLKSGGLAYIAWHPVWTGPFGHHIHDDMVHRRARRLNVTSLYANNGSFIPPWGHLLHSRDELRTILLNRPGMGPPSLIDGLLDFIYNDRNLNRAPLRRIQQALQRLDWAHVFNETNGCIPDQVDNDKQDHNHVASPKLSIADHQQLEKLYPMETRFDLGPCIFAAIK